MNAIVAILNIIGNVIFIPEFSFIGSAWVTLITQILLMSITWWYIRDTIHVRRSLRFVLSMGMISIIGIWLSTYFVNSFLQSDMSLLGSTITVIIAGIIFSIVYVG